MPYFWQLAINPKLKTQNSIISFGYVDSYAKIFLIFYPPIKNSTTCIAIVISPPSLKIFRFYAKFWAIRWWILFVPVARGRDYTYSFHSFPLNTLALFMKFNSSRVTYYIATRSQFFLIHEFCAEVCKDLLWHTRFPFSSYIMVWGMQLFQNDAKGPSQFARFIL